MTKLKQITIAFSIAVTLVAVGVFVAAQPTTPEPDPRDSPEPRHLAEEHAQCAGFYMVLRSSLGKKNPNYQELDYSYASGFENHMKMGLAFSLNKDAFRSKVQDGARTFGQQVIAVAEKEKARALVDAKIAQCVDALFRSSDYIQQLAKIRTTGQ
jgi:hypothetical protein